MPASPPISMLDRCAAKCNSCTPHIRVCKCAVASIASLPDSLSDLADRHQADAQAEVQQLQEQLFNAQQGKNEELEALKVSSSGLQTQLAAAIAEASQLRVELEKSAQEAQVWHTLLAVLSHNL